MRLNVALLWLSIAASHVVHAQTKTYVYCGSSSGTWVYASGVFQYQLTGNRNTDDSALGVVRKSFEAYIKEHYKADPPGATLKTTCWSSDSENEGINSLLAFVRNSGSHEISTDWGYSSTLDRTTAEGEGSTKAVALSQARFNSEKLYGGSIRKWGAVDCAEVPKPTAYDVAGKAKTVIHCSSEFFVSNDKTLNNARSAFGEAPNQQAALSLAKARAQHLYGERIASWSEPVCSSETKSVSKYAVGTAKVWECLVDYTTAP